MERAFCVLCGSYLEKGMKLEISAEMVERAARERFEIEHEREEKITGVVFCHLTLERIEKRDKKERLVNERRVLEAALKNENKEEIIMEKECNVIDEATEFVERIEKLSKKKKVLEALKFAHKKVMCDCGCGGINC